MSRPFYFSAWASFSSRVRFPFTGAGRLDWKKLLPTATAKSAPFAKRPSLYPLLVCAALGISSLLALTPDEQSPEIANLRGKGWVAAEKPSCPSIQAGFYELESEQSTVEFWTDGQQTFAPPPATWPEPPFTCRPILTPSNIQEIQ